MPMTAKTPKAEDTVYTISKTFPLPVTSCVFVGLMKGELGIAVSVVYKWNEVYMTTELTDIMYVYTYLSLCLCGFSGRGWVKERSRDKYRKEGNFLS